MNRLVSFVENKVMGALVIGVTILFILSIWEKMVADETMSLGRAAVQALTLDAPEEGFTLYLRFVVNITLAWAVIRVYIASAGLSFDRLIARRFSHDHTVIVAESDTVDYSARQIGRNNFYLAYDLALKIANTSKVVFVVPNISDDKRTRLWNAGIKVLNYQKNIPIMLIDAGTNRATNLFSMRASLDENLAICRVALSSQLANTSLTVFCQVPSQGEKRRFNPEFYYDAETLVRFRSFNEAQMIARDLLRRFPPDAASNPLDDAPIHIGLFGFGEIGQAIIEHFARIGHYRNGQKAIVSIFADDLDIQFKSVAQELPAIADWLEIRCYGSSEKSDVRINSETLDGMRRAYVCHANEVVNLRISKALLDLQSNCFAVPPNGLDVITIDPPGGILLGDFWANSSHKGKFYLYSLASSNLNQVNVESSILLNGEIDRRARLLHEAYVEKELIKLKVDASTQLPPYAKPWDELSENIRDANRRVADHFEVKVRAIGCSLGPIDIGDEVLITVSELEELAIMEHRRWWADRALNGWKYGPERSDPEKIHPNMVPYDALSEADKQKDRDFVLEVISVFREEGLIIMRTGL